ncbi:hypothetical protein BG46_01320 [Brucella anthropi]|uniref:hypothetical protein n=1 Tax=Brucella anthropi TaxID=529 RepID=UPI00044BF2C8|nr:hypothetical protein [Brucella anthropi]EXL08569.1 hypothetical protein BG46_01320 [Brucella anthropi]
MSAEKLPSLPDGLKALVDRFEQFNGIADTEVLPMTGENGRTCLALVRMLYHLALIQERELGALRMLAGDSSGQPKPGRQPTSDGNVVHFPRNARSKPKLVKSPDTDPA